MLTFSQRKPPNYNAIITFTLSLTAEERTRSRNKFILADGKEIFLRLARGTVLNDGDILTNETESIYMRIIAKPESVLTAYAEIPLLLRAAYHLGNRHVPVEITPTYLRLSPDAVLAAMLTQLGLEIKEEVVPFKPELGAYGNHAHT